LASYISMADVQILRQLYDELLRQELGREQKKPAEKPKIGDVFAIKVQDITVLLDVVQVHPREVEARVFGANGYTVKIPKTLIHKYQCDAANMTPFLRDIPDTEWDIEKVRKEEAERRQQHQYQLKESPEALEKREIDILVRVVSNIVKRNIVIQNFVSEYIVDLNLRKYAHSAKVLEEVRQRVNQEIAAAGFELTTLAQASPTQLAIYMTEIPLWQ
jgi:hypothetical protein